MNTQDENHIDQLLKHLQPEKAPFGLENKIMSRIENLPEKQVMSLIDRLFSVLLVFSLVSMLAFGMYFIGFEQVKLYLASFVAPQYNLLSAAFTHLHTVADSLLRIPFLFMVSITILSLLLIAERFLLRRKHSNSFLNLLV